MRSRYFFFKENCAFNLLYPIEAARPSVKLVRRFRMSAVPVSLLQQLADTGVTGDPVFRPSKASVMQHLASLLSPEEIGRTRELVEAVELGGSVCGGGGSLRYGSPSGDRPIRHRFYRTDRSERPGISDDESVDSGGLEFGCKGRLGTRGGVGAAAFHQPIAGGGEGLASLGGVGIIGCASPSGS